MKFNDISGVRFGRLVAQQPIRCVVNDRSRIKWRCLCDCGAETIIAAYSLHDGNTSSCGCYQRETARKRRTLHGRSGTRLHMIWSDMLARCLNSKTKAYHNYGGRGITVCERWKKSFVSFAEDVGPRPSPQHTIDRYPDNDGNYEPGNVRWATRKEQGRNRRGLRKVSVNGAQVCLAEAAEAAGLSRGTVRSRIIKHGWPVKDALTVPAIVGQKHMGKSRKPFNGPAERRVCGEAEMDELLKQAVAVMNTIQWRSADKDNMEFAATITYSQMDKIKAIATKLDAALAQQLRDAPEGWVLVPEEPTDKMLNCLFSMRDGELTVNAYRAMLASAPSPSDPKGDKSR